MTLPRHTTMTPQALKSLIRTIPDYPSPGVMFRDITTLVGDAAGLRAVVAAFEERYCNARLTAIVGIEARGFIFGAPLACMLGLAFIPARKKGKLPGPAAGQDYALEYGTDRLEIHLGSLGPHDRVLVVDDLLATGGTAQAAVTLIRILGATVAECAFVVDLPDLGGRARLAAIDTTVFTLCAFDGD